MPRSASDEAGPTTSRALALTPLIAGLTYGAASACHAVGVIARRRFLALGAAGAAAGLAAACSKSPPAPMEQGAAGIRLTAGETDIDLGGVTVRTWAYGNHVPAEEIRIKKGDRLRAELTNALPHMWAPNSTAGYTGR